jgi:hypothetical protein
MRVKEHFETNHIEKKIIEKEKLTSMFIFTVLYSEPMRKQKSNALDAEFIDPLTSWTSENAKVLFLLTISVKQKR